MQIVYYKPNNSNSSSFPSKQYTNNGITDTKNGMPSKFGISDGTNTFSMGRSVYLNTYLANKDNIQSLTDKFNNKKNNCTVGRNNTCNVGKSLKVESSDQYIQRLKNKAIGSGSKPDPTTNKLSFKRHDYNTVVSALRRNRNSGSVPPPKIAARPTANCSA